MIETKRRQHVVLFLTVRSVKPTEVQTLNYYVNA